MEEDARSLDCVEEVAHAKEIGFALALAGNSTLLAGGRYTDAQVNGEWAGQSGFVINDLLRDRLGIPVMGHWKMYVGALVLSFAIAVPMIMASRGVRPSGSGTTLSLSRRRYSL